MSNLEAVHQHIREQFELVRKLHFRCMKTKPCWNSSRDLIATVGKEVKYDIVGSEGQ